MARFIRSRHNPLGIILWLGSLLVVHSDVPAATVTAKLQYSHSTPRSRKGDNSHMVVWLTPLSEAAIREAAEAFQKLPRHYQLLQKGKQFDPHLLVVPAGSAVDFPNDDPFFHNVFSLFEGKRFDLGLYEAGTTRAVRFDRPGVSFIFCNIHPQMGAVVITLRTPFWGVTNRAGDVTIDGLPPGRYRLDVWAERSLPETLRTLTREITLGEEKASLGSIEVKESGNLLAGHKNKYGRDYEPVAPPIPAYQRSD